MAAMDLPPSESDSDEDLDPNADEAGEAAAHAHRDDMCASCPGISRHPGPWEVGIIWLQRWWCQALPSSRVALPFCRTVEAECSEQIPREEPQPGDPVNGAASAAKGAQHGRGAATDGSGVMREDTAGDEHGGAIAAPSHVDSGPGDNARVRLEGLDISS